MSARNYYKSYSHDEIHKEFRLKILNIIVIFLSLSLVLRLAYLQLAQYKKFATLSLKNQMSIMPIAPSRGVIVDRNEVTLAENIPVFALEIIPEKIQDIKQTIAKLQQLLPSITNEDIENFYLARKRYRAYDSIPLKLKLTEEEVAVFASNQYQFPGVNVKARLMRHYPLAENTAHIVGYVGRLNIQDLQSVDYANYRATNAIGKSGVEKFYESKLHGKVGYLQVETDVSGRTLRSLSKQEPVPGTKIHLTIDAELQKKAHNILSGIRGSVVVINPNNGEILAMVSSPSFDPNLFTGGISTKQYSSLINSPSNPLFNRSIRGLYPPASTIKPFLALVALDRNIINPWQTIADPGWFKIDGTSHIYRDWKRIGHGLVNLKRALVVSCDTYFYQLGNKLGIGAIEDILNQLGFGQFTKVDLPEEARGLVPSPAWKKIYQNMNWYTGDTIISAIGQGSMMASPLQLATATGTLATKGKRFQPHLLAGFDDAKGQHHPYKVFEEYPLTLRNDNHWDVITNAMRDVILSKDGTGHRFGRDAEYSVAAKTGTAQVYNESSYAKKSYKDTPYFLRDHSLFIGFAPIKKPEIAVAIIVEHDYIASSIARKVMDAYFTIKKERKA